MTSIVTVTRGLSPLILSMPHPGTGLPSEVEAALNERGRLVEDTDWHMRERLYADIAERFQPTIVEAKLSRYRHRPEPRSVGRLALSRTGDDRAGADDDLRWRADLDGVA